MRRTNVIKGNCNPDWNYGPEELTLCREAGKLLKFEVRDKDFIGWGSHLGQATLGARECVEGYEGPLDLGDGNGQLYVKVVPGAGPAPLKLSVTVVSASGLRNTDWSLFDRNNVSDPYVVCKVRNKEMFRTEVIDNNLNPVWNHSPQALELKAENDLRFEIYDMDTGLTAGDWLGTATMSWWECEAADGRPITLDLGRDSKGNRNGTMVVRVQRAPGASTQRWKKEEPPKPIPAPGEASPELGTDSGHNSPAFNANGTDEPAPSLADNTSQVSEQGRRWPWRSRRDGEERRSLFSTFKRSPQSAS